MVQAAMPAGATAMVRMVPAAALPAVPGSTARAGTSTTVSPASRTPSCVVSKRTRPAVMHTVPAGMVRSAFPACSVEKRRIPSARAASFRLTPRRAACRSRYSPAAVWGKHWSAVHAA